MTATEAPTTVELREKLLDQATKLRELRQTPPERRGDSFESDASEAIRTIHSLDAELSVAETYERGLRAWADALEASQGPSAAMADVGGREGRTLGEQITEGAEYAEWRDRGARYGEFRMEIADEIRTLITGSTSDTSASGVWKPVGQPIPPVPRQLQFYIRDLLASGNTSLGSFPYIRELNAATNESGASAVAEASAKPEATMSFVQVTATTHKIATWVPATEEVLADAPTLRSYIDARLVYMVKFREQADLLLGVESGANPTIPGILTVSGVQTQGPDQSNSVDDAFKTFALAIGKIENVDGQADGIAMNPLDYWAANAIRWGTAGGQFDASPFTGPPGTLWGLPVVRTRALAQYRAVVGAWRMGGQIFDRIGVTVRSSDSHDDYFVKNKVAILAEERLAVAWYRPDFFVDCDIHT
jgi:HK97 family phage major capsid protein